MKVIIIKILIIEGNEELSNKIKTLVEAEGFTAEASHEGKEGLMLAELGVYDLLVVDSALNDINGFEICKSLRASKCAIPIIIMTETTDTDDRIKGLEVGIDYGIKKPFDGRELIACVKMLLRRNGNEIDELRYGNTSLELQTGMLRNGNKTVRLSAKEFDIMRLLLTVKERNISKDHIIGRVWGYDSEAGENHVEVYMVYLRKKLQAIDSNVRIEAVRRLGYHLEIVIDEVIISG